MVTFGNINATENRDRYISLLVLTWIFTSKLRAWHIYSSSDISCLNSMDLVEYKVRDGYVHVRQRYLIHLSHSSTAQARTVLVTGIPQEFLTEFALTRLFSHLLGDVHEVWINRDLGDIPELYNQRLKACQKLESAVTSLLHKAIKRNRKRLRNPANFGDGRRDIVSNAELTDFVSDPETRGTLLEELVQTTIA